MAAILLSFIHCLLLLLLWFCVGSLFCSVVLDVLSSLAIILLSKKALVVLL